MLAVSDGLTLHEVAPAKINLALHVTGQRPDGYHLLDSLVAFAALTEEGGDTLELQFGGSGAHGPTLSVDGPFAHHVPAGPENSVVKAAVAVGGIAHIRLTKHLPVAAGIGGGSGDAAAVLRAAASARRRALPDYSDIALALGADVPVCVMGRPARMGGIGEVLKPVSLPAIPALLVNPGVPLGTPAVFGALDDKTNVPLPQPLEDPTLSELFDWLSATRNDLERAAIHLAPQVAETIKLVAALPGCAIARMSGSGATVFGLFAREEERDAALSTLRSALTPAQRQTWWTAAAGILPGTADGNAR